MFPKLNIRRKGSLASSAVIRAPRNQALRRCLPLSAAVVLADLSHLVTYCHDCLRKWNGASGGGGGGGGGAFFFAAALRWMGGARARRHSRVIPAGRGSASVWLMVISVLWPRMYVGSLEHSSLALVRPLVEAIVIGTVSISGNHPICMDAVDHVLRSQVLKRGKNNGRTRTLPTFPSPPPPSAGLLHDQGA